MTDDQILMDYLDNAVAEARAHLKKTKHLEDKHATSLMLKSQFNHLNHMEGHIKHLEDTMVTKEVFNLKIGVLSKEIGILGGRMTFLQWLIVAGIAFLAMLIQWPNLISL